MSRTTSVAIIGLGSRGLSVLERVVTLAKLRGPGSGALLVDVIDPRCDGAGTHATGQPDYLLLNTTAAHVSMFPDAATVGADVDAPGPSLYQWVTARGLRVGGDGFTVGAAGRPVRPNDFLPRRVLGEYLGWFLGQVVERAPAHVTVRLHRASAVDLTPDPDDRLTITLSDGTGVTVDQAFLTTGYTANGDEVSHDGVLAAPYPLPERTAGVGAGESVAIGGFGLAALDMMSSLTVGRGGRFVGPPEDLTYLPSGREPALVFYSRSGAPCRARPLVVDFGAKYQPFVFTHDAIDGLRRSRGGPLDFDRDVLPLIVTEMRIAYRRCAARCAGGDAERVLLDVLTAASETAVAPVTVAPQVTVGPEVTVAPEIIALLDELDRRDGPFDARAALDTATGMLLSDSATYQDWLTDLLRRDLADGLLGFAGSPVKAALDILRDQRDMFRYAVDYGGLTDRSLEDFNRATVPVVNRAVVGPQFERHSELLALVAAGVARTPFGPSPQVTRSPGGRRWHISSTALGEPYAEEVDWIASAHVPWPAVEPSASPLLRSLVGNGLVRPFRPGSAYVLGLDIDRDHHPIRADGQAERRLWVLGPLCEGATFYTNLVPSPDTFSRPIFDAHRLAAGMLAAASRTAASRTADARTADAVVARATR